MRRLFGAALLLGCLAALVVGCFGNALFRGEQFGYRDAAHYYYPLYQRVQQVWEQGRLPLWDARENAGMPLLGNPTAAVLYPLKIVYAVMPYAWAARSYIILHALLAVVGMYRMLRDWDVSRTGSAIAGLSYGFAAPVLFQYCNVIYLVGAAWVPFGLTASDRWLRRGRRGAIVELALVLAMQVLGGDPQEAYLVGLCASGYAVGMALALRSREWTRRWTARHIGLATFAIIVAWVVISLACAWIFPKFRVNKMPPPPLSWSSKVPLVVFGCWVGLALTIAFSWRKRPRDRVLPPMFGGLVMAAALAGLVSAAQLLPVLEYTGKTERVSDEGTHDIFPFSLEIHRVAEVVWPGVFGLNSLGNRSWHAMIPPHHKIEFWVPSLYMGGLSIVLAISALGFRDSRQAWLTCIFAVSLLASFGQFGSPLWVARNIPALAQLLGPLDPMETGPIRRDFYLRDGEGGFYWMLATILPGFGSFRYPSKLFTFTVAALAGLAGLGWDRVLARQSRRPLGVATTLLVLSLSGLACFHVFRSGILAFFTSRASGSGNSAFGPFEPIGAWTETRNAFLIGSAGMAAITALLVAVRRFGLRSEISGTIALVLLSADLLVANSGLVITVPQSYFETEPIVLKKILEAEATDPSPGPYRIHRMPAWSPYGWSLDSSPGRHREMVEWERKTIQPKYGIPLGVSYTLAEGVGTLYDYEWFFSPFHGKYIDDKAPKTLENKYVYFPRRGYDLWNSRYFVLPSLNKNDAHRAITSFLMDSVPISPRPEEIQGPGGKAYEKEWMIHQDWRIVRNRNAYPRAWVVHNVNLRLPIVGYSGNEERKEIMYKLLYQNDAFWTMTGWNVHDPHREAWVEVESEAWQTLYGSISHREPDPSETPVVQLVGDEEVRIEANLKSPGLLILSDVYYPGWEATIDNKPTRIYRTNRLMRGVAVPSGPHTIIFRYRPLIVTVGFAISGLGLIALIAAFVWSRRGPRIGDQIRL